jgi:hypothetical protein
LEDQAADGGCGAGNESEDLAAANAEIPDIQWDRVPTVHWLLADFVISQGSPTFQSGVAYRLVIRNIGEDTHVLNGLAFYDALAIKSVETSAFPGHSGEDHVEEPIGAKGLDGVPKIPEINGISDDDEDFDSANPFAAAPGEDDDSPNPFAAQPGDGDEATDDSDPYSENPVAEIPDDEIPAADDEPVQDNQSAAADGDDQTAAMVDEADADPVPAAWRPLKITEISVEPGHETTIEFIAIRPGVYSLSSARWLSAIFGMFARATIEPPSDDEAETETAAAK